MPDQTSYDTGVPCWVDLATTDADAAVRFYTPDIAASTAWLEQVFGVTTEDVPGTPNPYKTFAVGGQVRGGIQQMGSDAERFPSHWMTYFGVEDADAMVRKVAAAGGRVNQEPFDTGFGRMAVVSDPQGAVFMINQWLPE